MPYFGNIVPGAYEHDEVSLPVIIVQWEERGNVWL